MLNREHLLISLEERHARNILSGVKSVELRRRTMHVNQGDKVWFYVKRPIAAIVGYAIVGECVTASLNAIWRRFGSVSGIKRSEFVDYFDGASEAFALGLGSPKTLKRSISLGDIRGTLSSFHPPQFYCRIPSNSVLQDLLAERGKLTR